MIHQDFASLQGYRKDGRKPNETRDFYCESGQDDSVDGSSYIKQGLSEVICLIKGPIPKQSQKHNDDNLINVDYYITPFSGLERRKISQYDKDWSEFSENLRISFESLVCKEIYTNSEIKIYVSILQSDGSTKSTIFNAITLALMDAGIAMKDFMISQTTGLLNSTVITDLTYNEQQKSNGELIISYLPRTQKIDFLELKCSKITTQDYENLVKEALNSCQKLHQIMKQSILENSLKKLLYSK